MLFRSAIMAIMEDKTLKHGPLEALITADEETGMFGAFGLKPGTVDGDILLNLDSEEEVAALEAQSGEKMAGSPRRIPLLFKVDVPRQGNYKVTLTIRSEEEIGEVLIFTGRRRLAFYGRVGAGEFTYTMITNVCDIVPVGYSRIFADKTVDIAVLADRPILLSTSYCLCYNPESLLIENIIYLTE